MPLPWIIGGAIAIGAFLYKAMEDDDDEKVTHSYSREETEYSIDDKDTKHRVLRDRAESVIIKFNLPMEVDELVKMVKSEASSLNIQSHVLVSSPGLTFSRDHQSTAHKKDLLALINKSPTWKDLNNRSRRIGRERRKLRSLLERLED